MLCIYMYMYTYIAAHLLRPSGATHMKRPYRQPTPICRDEIVMGKPVFPPAARKASLLVMFCEIIGLEKIGKDWMGLMPHHVLGRD